MSAAQAVRQHRLKRSIVSQSLLGRDRSPGARKGRPGGVRPAPEAPGPRPEHKGRTSQRGDAVDGWPPMWDGWRLEPFARWRAGPYYGPAAAHPGTRTGAAGSGFCPPLDRVRTGPHPPERDGDEPRGAGRGLRNG
jgi:hypothetical protein